MKAINAILGRLGIWIVPAGTTSQMLHEHANISETHHPSGGGRTVAWLRATAAWVR